MTLYIGVNNSPKKIKNFYIGVDGKAKKVKKAYIGIDGKAKLFYSFILPPEFQQVQWIQNSNNNQYISTGVKLSSNINLIFDMNLIDDTVTIGDLDNSGTVSKAYYIDIKASNSNVLFYLGNLQSSYQSTFYWNPSSSNITTTINMKERHVWNFNDSNGFFWIDDIKMGEYSGSFDDTNLSNLFLFRSTNGNNYFYNKYQLRHFQAINNYSGNLIRDMYPCYRKSDNEIGMYDLVNNVFYTNDYDFNTGTYFIKGPDV